jgi:hypothetical protein
MSSIRTITVAALLSVTAAAPALAQAAIKNPGYFASVYPNLDVLNGGAPTPAYYLQGQPPSVLQAYNLRDAGLAGRQVPRRHADRWHARRW